MNDLYKERAERLRIQFLWPRFTTFPKIVLQKRVGKFSVPVHFGWGSVTPRCPQPRQGDTKGTFLELMMLEGFMIFTCQGQTDDREVTKEKFHKD